MKTLINSILFFVSLIAAFTICEVVLKVFYHPSQPAAGWRSFSDSSEQNQLGFRGQEISYGSDDKVIILLGDSQAEGEGCSFKQIPEKRLEHHLENSGIKVSVFTIGAGGYGQDQELLALKEYFRHYRANMVILWQTPKNDIWNNMFPTHWPRDGMVKPTFILKTDSLTGPVWKSGELLFNSRFRTVSLLKQFFSPDSYDKFWERYLPPPYNPMSEYEGTPDTTWQKSWNNNLFDMKNENLANEKSHLAMWLTPRSRRTRYGLELTRQLISEIEQTSKSENSAFMLFYLDYPGNDPLRSDTVYLLNGKYYRCSTEQFHNNMNYINSQFDSHVIPVELSDWRVGRYDSHLNERAVDDVMKKLSVKIVNKLTKQNNRNNINGTY